MQSDADHRKYFSKEPEKVSTPLRIKEKVVNKTPIKSATEMDEDGFTLVVNRRKSKFLSWLDSKVGEKMEEPVKDFMKGRKIEIFSSRGNEETLKEPANIEQNLKEEWKLGDYVLEEIVKEHSKREETLGQKVSLDSHAGEGMIGRNVSNFSMEEIMNVNMSPIKMMEEKKEEITPGNKGISREKFPQEKEKWIQKEKRGNPQYPPLLNLKRLRIL
ncbi:hypothetical protein KI387_034138 [Taxus chinensis]|uniref:Uncharacterized protein n=1 Tax=Taxus chinensis TaxID=29808 RepID=A0AA38F616_TAXCH|nr:hypothetical protein KI387_034138 [Taxus chinensis]